MNKISQFCVYSAIDFRKRHHHVPIKLEDKPYTAFEAAGRLYQFIRVPSGVTNGVACLKKKDRQAYFHGEVDRYFWPTWMMSQYVVWHKRNTMTIWRLSLKLQNSAIWHTALKIISFQWLNFIYLVAWLRMVRFSQIQRDGTLFKNYQFLLIWKHTSPIGLFFILF